MSLQPHQQRVVDEKRDLDEKLQKLADFIENPFCKTLDNDEQCRLRRQRDAMRLYSSILAERIAAF